MFANPTELESIKVAPFPPCTQTMYMDLPLPSEAVDKYELIEEGPASKVVRTYTSIQQHSTQWLVVKSSTTVRRFAKEPHDIIKELRVLFGLVHPNIIEVWNDSYNEQWKVLHIWEPYIPIKLSEILASPLFSPFIAPSLDLSSQPRPHEPANQNKFTHIARSIIYQVLQAIAYLHASPRRIAHRDIKPRNILLTVDGCVKLIDFGIAFTETEEGDVENTDPVVEVELNDLWPEKRPRMYFEVSTGPYRAPELLFGTRDYDAFAIDLWSAGTTFAEFFTPLRLCRDSSYDLPSWLDEESDNEEPDADEGEGEDNVKPKPLDSFIVPRRLRLEASDQGQETVWERDTLFNGTRGEIGLAWSIFKVRGTPTESTWPEFFTLPDAKSVEFTIVPPVPLESQLPNLPPSLDSDSPLSGPVDLIDQLLAYQVEKRLSAEKALRHPWFMGRGDGEAGLLLPKGYPERLVEVGMPLDGHGDGKEVKVVEERNGKSLGDLIRDVLGWKSDT